MHFATSCDSKASRALESLEVGECHSAKREVKTGSYMSQCRLDTASRTHYSNTMTSRTLH
jgi:hypothetical protein